MPFRPSHSHVHHLGGSFSNHRDNTQLLAMLPAGIDPCGENGEFHTFISAGPMFPRAIQVVPGEVVVREGFAFADLLLEP